MHPAVQALPPAPAPLAPAHTTSDLSSARRAGKEIGLDAPTADPRSPVNLRGSPARRALLAMVVAGAHVAGLAALVHLGSQQATPPEIVPIQVALIEAEPVARPAPEPAPAPEPEPIPAPPPPAPPPPEVRRQEPPPPKPAPRKPTPKPAVRKETVPVTESQTALSAPVEAAPEPAPSTPAPSAPPAPAAAPPAPAVAAVTAARFDAAYLNNPRPAYPMLSRRLREEGQVTLRVLVSPEGQPARVELRTSSGSERLDRAAEEAVARWRFVPARRGDTPIEAWVLVPIVFKLQGN
ncbi:MAG: periplasmic protein TonB [Rhodocyclaceae bacterium]|nr:periplasmic protein TonB [Rhodocyclaceae bacterium]